MTEQDKQGPWYTHFWPWFVLLLLGSAVTASLYTFYLASQGDDSLVVDGDEGTEVITERNLVADRKAAELALAAEMTHDAATGAVNVTLTEGTLADQPTTLELWVSHPTFADRDQRITLTTALPDASGRPRWTGVLLDNPSGKRYVILSNGEAWRIHGVWNGEPLLRLVHQYGP